MFAAKLILALAIAWSVIGTIVLLFLPPALKIGRDRTALWIGGPLYWLGVLRTWLLERVTISGERWIDLAYVLFAVLCALFLFL